MKSISLKTLCRAGWMLMFILPTVFCCDRCLQESKVAYYASSQDVDYGACGYESLARTLNGGDVAAATAKIYREGVGCGACYHIRCTNQSICTTSGVKVVVTDYTPNNQADFVVSSRTFCNLAQPSKSAELVKIGIPDVEYKRVPCEYPGQNMTVKIDKISSYPNFLAVQFLYQGGQTDIISVDVVQEGSSNWNYMTHNYGAVWSMEDPPMGELSFRMVVMSGYDRYWVLSKRGVVPSNWKVRSMYDTGVQIKQIAAEECSPSCDNKQDCSSCDTQNRDHIN